MDSTVENSPPIDVSTLIGKRYTMEQMRPILASHLDLSSSKVPANIGQEIKKLLDGKQTNIIPLKDGSEAKLSVINNPTHGLSINVMQVQARLLLRDSYLGHTFTTHDKENLQRFGDMGRAVQLIDVTTGNPFKGLIGIDPVTQRMTVINTTKFPIPDKLLGVTIDDQAKERLREGLSIRVNNMKKDDQTFSAFVRLAASKKGFKFERIKPPTIEQSPQTKQYKSPAAGDRISATPELDKLAFSEKGVRQSTLTHPNGVEVMVIPQSMTHKFVLSIKLPEVAQTPENSKLFVLPIMASKADTESVLKLSLLIDKAIGKNEPLLPILQQAPLSVQQLLNLELVQALQQKAAAKNESGPSVTSLNTPVAKRSSDTPSQQNPEKSKKTRTSQITNEPQAQSTPNATKSNKPGTEPRPKRTTRH